MSTPTTVPLVHRKRLARRLALAVLLGLIVLGLYPMGRYAWASIRYEQAQRAIARRDFPAARRYLDICAEEWPKSGEVRFLAARTARRAGDIEAAQRLLRDAERLGWVREAIDLERALIHVQMGQYQNVGARLMDFIRHNHPDSLLILEVLTPTAMRSFEAAMVQECLDIWLQRDPANPQPHLIKGDVLERLRNRNEALKYYQEAVRLAPDHFEARLRLGQLQLDMRSPDQAKEQFDWLLARRPEDRAVRRGMARTLHELGENGAARDMLAKLLDEKPDDGHAHAIVGAIDLNEGKWAAAEKHLREASARIPAELDILFKLQRALTEQDKKEEAEQIRKRMVQGEEDQKKVTELMRGLAANPRNPEARRQIAIRLMRNGMEADGKKWLETALQQDPEHIESHYEMAAYYDRFGQTRMAEVHRDVAKQIRERKQLPTPPPK